MREGEASHPTLTIISPGDVWLKMARGEINRPKALMDGLFRAVGDMNLLVKMGEIFKTPAKADSESPSETPGAARKRIG